MALMAANLFGHPSEHMKLVGITGTNGKTTSTYLVKSVLESGGGKVLLIGTIEYILGDTVLQTATHTTPESLDLQRLMASALADGASSTVMEVSSHALAMNRVYGIPFKAAVFTNLTQDHLDFHLTMEEYFKAKKILFDSLSPESFAIVNIDDEYGKRIVADTRAKKVYYGFRDDAEFRVVRSISTDQGTLLDIRYGGNDFRVDSALVGKFNAYNLTGSFAVGVMLGCDPAVAAESLGRVKNIKGRFERLDSGKGFLVIIDYAHSPDSLQKTLQAARELLYESGKGGRLINVFGCGGNRDKTKRPRMGKISEDLSDLTIVTSDNPRFEDPAAIVDEIMKGMTLQPDKVFRIVDRSEAIVAGLKLARPDDIVVIAGKGHENYQDIKGVRRHFDDREEVEKELGLKN